MVASNDGTWIHFDYVPEEAEIRRGAADVTGKICVIGSELKEDALADLFRRTFFSPAREKVLEDPAWAALAVRGVKLGLLPADLYGESRPVPHVGRVDPAHFVKGVVH